MNFRRFAKFGGTALALMFVMNCARTSTPVDFTSEPTVNQQFELALSVPKGTETELVPDSMLSASDVWGKRLATDVWIEMIRGARRTIDLGQFYLTSRPDTAFAIVLNELTKAVGRGVRIRLLADKMMWEKTAQDDQGGRTLLEPFTEIRLIDFNKVNPDAVHHAKYMIVDRRDAFVGSQNLDWRSFEENHELGLKITDPTIVNAISAVFEHDWLMQMGNEVGEPMVPNTNRSRFATPALECPTRFFVSPYQFTPPEAGNDAEMGLVFTIDNAHETIDIQVMEYAPLNRDGTAYTVIDHAVRVAMRRHVKVRIMVDASHAKGAALTNLKDLSYLGAEIKVVTIPNPDKIPHARVIHSKYMVVDGHTLWLGTSNWSGGYLNKSRNLEIRVTDEGLAKQALAIYNLLWNSPYAEPITLVSAGIPK